MAVDRQPTRGGAIAILVAHVALVVLAGVLVLAPPTRLNPHRTSTTAQRPRCAVVQVHDDLVHIALRPRDDARAEAWRWKHCEPKLIGAARRALRLDSALIATIAIALGLAIWRGWHRSRWRRSAYFALGFAVLYVAADLWENGRLSHGLDHPAQWSEALRWVSAVKLGAVAAALPMFLVSLVIAVGDVRGRRTDPGSASTAREPAPPTKHLERVPARVGDTTVWYPAPSPRMSARWRRFRHGRSEWTTPPAPAAGPGAVTPAGHPPGLVPRIDPETHEAMVGVSCSGGGIRSAAFNLGALQALDTTSAAVDPTSATAQPGSEWDRVGMVSAVSGGSYLATAWVSARNDHSGRTPEAWARRSAEEDHLRRHASYIAPGFAGKVWAFLRFALGFLMNVTLIVLAVAVLMLPYGWAVGGAQDPVPASGGGSIRFEKAGARIVLPSGGVVTAVKGTKVRLAGRETAWLRAGIKVVEPGPRSTTTKKTTTTDTTTNTDTTGNTGTPSGSSIVEATADASTTERTTTTERSGAGTDAAFDHGLERRMRAATGGRTLPAGTKVVLAVDRHPVKVVGRVLGCLDSDPGPCTVRSAHFVVLERNARLATARRAVLTTRGDAVVEHRALFKACGAHPCEHVSRRWVNGALLGALALALVLGMIAVAARPRERLRAASQRGFRWIATAGFLGALVLVVLPAMVSWVEGRRWSLEEHRRLAGVSVLTVVLALVAQVVPLIGSGSTPSTPGKVVTAVKSLGTRLRPWLVRIAVYVAAPLILLGIALFFSSFAAQREINPGQLVLWLALLGPLLVIGAGADLNQWSLHPYYRERLITAFGVEPDTLAERSTRNLDELPKRPELIVCGAANVNDVRLTAPGRPVIPWEFSRTAVGAPALSRVFNAGATVPASALEQKLAPLRSLWTSVAISGAAVSPSMGKMTRPERALMAIGNIRLGVWCPNPAMLAADPTWYQRHHPNPVYVAKEAFGMHRATDPWVYVTDGGHYENLGLMELLRRDVREIYCFDASGDSVDTFGTMADAMRLAREELGVEIGFRPEHLKPDTAGISPLGVSAATISDTQPDGSLKVSGWLVFAKLEVPKGAPFDIIDLARTLPKFPNHPTTDQLYTDQKFEAYRALGQHLGACATDLAHRIRTHLANDPDIARAVEVANAAIAPAVPAPGGATAAAPVAF